MIGLIEFARKKGSKDKQKRKRRIGIAATGLAGYGALGAGMNALALTGRKPIADLYEGMYGPDQFKKIARSGLATSAGLIGAGMYLQHRRNKKLREQGYTEGNALIARQPSNYKQTN